MSRWWLKLVYEFEFGKGLQKACTGTSVLRCTWEEECSTLSRITYNLINDDTKYLNFFTFCLLLPSLTAELWQP